MNAAEKYVQDGLTPPEAEGGGQYLNEAERAFLEKYLGIGLDAAMAHVPQVDPPAVPLEGAQPPAGELARPSADLAGELEQAGLEPWPDLPPPPKALLRAMGELDWPLDEPAAAQEPAPTAAAAVEWVERLAEGQPAAQAEPADCPAAGPETCGAAEGVPPVVAETPPAAAEAQPPAAREPAAAAMARPQELPQARPQSLAQDLPPAQPQEQLRLRKGLQLVGFTLDGREYALPMDVVQEVIRYVRPTRLPRAPRHLAGVVNLRGRITPLVNLRALLGHPRADGGDNFIIVCRQQSGRQGGRAADMQVGLVVSSMASIHRPEPEDMEWDLDGHSLLCSRLLAGLMRFGDRLVNVLSFDQLVGSALD